MSTPVGETVVQKKLVGYLPPDAPPWGAMLSLGFQQVLTMFPATVLVAILTKFDVGVTLMASGIGTIVALLVSGRRIPLYYGSSFSYITVVVTAMGLYANDCFKDPAQFYCPAGVRIVQVGILGTAVVEILVGFLIMRIGKENLDKVLPPIITGSVAIVIGIALAGTALNEASANWTVALITLLVTIIFSVYLQGKGLIGMLPILLGAIVGWLVSIPFGLIKWELIGQAAWVRVPNITFPAFTDPNAWAVVAGIALIAIATIPESTAHLYQMSLYIDQLAKELGRAPMEIKRLIGLNLVADGSDDIVVGLAGRLRRHQLWREQQPDGNHALLFGASFDDSRCDGLLPGMDRQAGCSDQHPACSSNRRPLDLPVWRYRNARYCSDPVREGQPV